MFRSKYNSVARFQMIDELVLLVNFSLYFYRASLLSSLLVLVLLLLVSLLLTKREKRIRVPTLIYYCISF
jgi:hypothetical protein